MEHLLETLPKFCLSGLVVEILTVYSVITEGVVLVEDEYIKHLLTIMSTNTEISPTYSVQYI